jgi:membrane fusion protein (multidrug efflux system)
MRPLIAKQEISQQQFDAYMAAADVAAAQLRAAQEQLTGARQTAQNARDAARAAQARVQQAQAGLQESRANQQQVGVTEARSKSAAAAIQQARANLAAAELNLSYTTIVAPMDGEVTNKSVEPGQIVQPGQGLMTIVPLRDVWVTANFKETQLARVQPGQRAEIKVDMYSRTIPGRVDSIAGATGARTSLLPPENATGNFVKVVQRIPVKIVFDRLPDGVVLRPGMNVEATIITR